MYAEGFEQTYAYASRGGNDSARLTDSTGDDTFSADGQANGARLQGVTFDFYAEGFERNYAYATRGGADAAALYDSTGDDTFTFAHPGGRFQGTAFDAYAESFDQYVAYAVRGGSDRAFLYDTPGDDVLQGQANWYQLTTPSASVRGQQFDYVKATANSGGLNTLDMDAVDYLFEHDGTWN